ncbi:HPP family protein [Streptomyces sp. NPDC058691]|uniref:HPP family protein n=1 Tax=Streptomyces sp. NPDC058691 TaxID=3346601 RepID=UPI003657CABF
MTDQTKALPTRVETPTAQPWFASRAPARPRTFPLIMSTCASVAALVLLVAVGKLLDETVLIPPLAASMALVAGASTTPLAQPRNVVGGQLISALVGFAAAWIGGVGVWSGAVAGGVALGAMLLARVGHSPAAATAVIVAMTQPPFWRFMALLALAVLILVAVGLAAGRIGKYRYPVYWW